jgi:hypothetical protein
MEALESQGFGNALDSLVLGGLDKAAGVEEKDVRFGRVSRQTEASLKKMAGHDLAVDQVLSAAVGNKGYGLGFVSSQG